MSDRAARLPFEFRMAWRYLASRHREGPVALVTLLCTGGVFVGVMALVLALALMDGMQGDIRRALLGSSPHVIVRPRVASQYTFEQAASIAAIGLVQAGVEAASPFTSQHGLLMSEQVPSGMPVELKGLNPEEEHPDFGLASMATQLGWKRLVEDGLRAGIVPAEPIVDAMAAEDEPLSAADLAPPEPPAILLGERLADRLAVVPGEIVRLVSAELHLSAVGVLPKSRAFRVAGLLKTGMPAFDETFAVAHVRRIAADPSGPAVDGVALMITDPMRAPLVAESMRSELGEAHEVRDWMFQYGQLLAAFKWEKLLMVLAIGLIGLVAGFNIFTILTLNVTARVADIGILSAIGASPASITRIFLWMGLLLGGGGTLAGLGAGAALATLLDRHRLIQLDASVYLIEHVPFRVQPGDLVVVGAGMLLVSFLATIIPARAAAGLDPVVALRNA